MSSKIKLEQGTKIANYQLSVKLGQGIFSETWLAEHCYLEGKEVCLKLFTNERFCNHLSKQKFLPVVKSPRFLPHLEDYDPHYTPAYLAQEMITGRSIRQLLRERKQLSLEMAFKILDKLTMALKALHEKNIAHLDIKPEHIFLDKNNDVKLIDYPLGKVTTLTMAEYYKEYTTGQSMPKTILRSLIYKPKRQRSGFEFDLRADIFALGILFFEMLTGTYPSRKAAMPSDLLENLPSKIDNIYAQCCGRADAGYENVMQLRQSLKRDQSAQAFAHVPGIQLLDNHSAIISVQKLAGNKTYVDGSNISTLSKNLDEITSSKLRYIAIDFCNVDYLSSSAIGYLINFNDRIHKLGGTMVMFHVDRQVQTILAALGLEKVVKILEDTQEVKKYLLSEARQSTTEGTD